MRNILLAEMLNFNIFLGVRKNSFIIAAKIYMLLKNYDCVQLTMMSSKDVKL